MAGLALLRFFLIIKYKTMKMKKRIMKRDWVISMCDEGDLVGVYLKDDPNNLLAEMHPQKADKIIKLWNN